jgi:heat shock protein HslJ
VKEKPSAIARPMVMGCLIYMWLSGEPSMRVRLALLGALVLCLLALGACDVPFFGIFSGSSSATSLPRSAATLSGSSWILTQLHTGGKTRTLVPTAPVTLQFQQGDGIYIGSSGCNYYNGAYAVLGDQLTLKFKSVTQVACVGPIMSQEVSYLNTLQQVRSYELSSHTLTMKDSAGEVILVFTAT